MATLAPVLNTVSALNKRETNTCSEEEQKYNFDSQKFQPNEINNIKKTMGFKFLLLHPISIFSHS